MQCWGMPGSGKAHRGVLYIQGGGLGVVACWKTCSGEETGREEQPLTSNDILSSFLDASYSQVPTNHYEAPCIIKWVSWQCACHN